MILCLSYLLLLLFASIIVGYIIYVYIDLTIDNIHNKLQQIRSQNFAFQQILLFEFYKLESLIMLGLSDFVKNIKIKYKSLTSIEWWVHTNYSIRWECYVPNCHKAFWARLLSLICTSSPTYFSLDLSGLYFNTTICGLGSLFHKQKEKSQECQ